GRSGGGRRPRLAPRAVIAGTMACGPGRRGFNWPARSPRVGDAMPSFPRWARQLAEQYQGGTIIEFIIHGNVSDYVPADTKEGRTFVCLRDFLATQMFPRRDVII